MSASALRDLFGGRRLDAEFVTDFGVFSPNDVELGAERGVGMTAVRLTVDSAAVFT